MYITYSVEWTLAYPVLGYIMLGLSDQQTGLTCVVLFLVSMYNVIEWSLLIVWRKVVPITARKV